MLHKITCAFKLLYLPRLSKVKRFMLLNYLLNDPVPCNSPMVYETYTFLSLFTLLTHVQAHKWILLLPFLPLCVFCQCEGISFFNTIVNPKVVKLQQSRRGRHDNQPQSE